MFGIARNKRREGIYIYIYSFVISREEKYHIEWRSRRNMLSNRMIRDLMLKY